MVSFLRAILVSLPTLLGAYAKLSNGRLTRHLAKPLVSEVFAENDPIVHFKTGQSLPPLDTFYYFDQLIDQTNPGLGTFKQRYWNNWEFYQTGGPIILFTPGEAGLAANFLGFLTNASIHGQIAQQEHGATVVLEHRYFGESTPTPDLSTPNLKYHTLQQAVDDLEYFARNVVLPMPGGDSVGPDVVPWVSVGGSYSGALTAWTMKTKPGLFWAGYASSAVVKAITDFWQYYSPAQKYMPQNCSADVQAVIAHIDGVFKNGNETEIDSIKANFGLSDLEFLDDVVGSLRANLIDWQSLTPATGPDGLFYQFCDALEVKDGVIAPASGWGADHALQAWGNFWTSGGYLDNLCGGLDVLECLGTHDPTNSLYTDTSLGNDERSWSWIICNEVGWYQEGPPVEQPSVVSTLLHPSYDERQCPYYFPEAFANGSTPAPDVDKTNTAYGGFDIHVDRLFFANGMRDPWRDATLSADGLNIQSTANQPIVLSDGFHTSDFSTKIAQIDPSVKAVQTQALQAMHEWLQEFKPSKRCAHRTT